MLILGPIPACSVFPCLSGLSEFPGHRGQKAAPPCLCQSYPAVCQELAAAGVSFDRAQHLWIVEVLKSASRVSGSPAVSAISHSTSRRVDQSLGLPGLSRCCDTPLPPLLALIIAMRRSTTANQAANSALAFAGGVAGRAVEFHFRRLPIGSSIFGPYSLGEALAGLGGPFVHFNVAILNPEAIVYWSCVPDSTSKVLQIQQVAAATVEIACTGPVERTLEPETTA